MKLPASIAAARRAQVQQYMQKSTGILHMGAHKGQEAPVYAELSKPVIWVEALPHIFQHLSSNIKKFEAQVAFCALLGNVSGRQYEFNISNNHDGQSSSIFEFGKYGAGSDSLWPSMNLEMIEKLTLPSCTIDDLLQNNSRRAEEYDFWVMDLQGAELLALEGGQKSLNACQAIYLEVSCVEVYKEAVLWRELKDYLECHGFIPLWQPLLDHDDVLLARSSKDQTRSIESNS